MTKILALYLPQFHQIKENDEWWGEGYTEWNVIKASKKLSKWSNYPRSPKDDYYYDLSKYVDIKHQVELANQYGVDGFILYSYYSLGNLLLEKPAEIIHENSNLNINYCFSWANHDWMRTWFSYNKEMLRKQEYAESYQDIINQFNYYLPFFKDSRYIKNVNKPVFFIYDYNSIPNFLEFKKIWNKMAIENGFDGIFFVQTLGGKNLVWDTNYLDACFDFEPTYTTFKYMKSSHKFNRFKRGIKKIFKHKRVVNYFNYNKVSNIMIKREENDKNHYLGSFAEWDNTPRHSHNGTIFKNFSLEKFEEQLDNQFAKSIKYGKDFLIIDAWNEWGEGAFLEPDNVYQNKKLEIIKKIKDKYEGE